MELGTAKSREINNMPMSRESRPKAKKRPFDSEVRQLKRDHELSLATVWVYLFIRDTVDRAKEEWCMWYGHRKIAEKCGISKRTVCRALEELRGAGLITTRSRGDGRTDMHIMVQYWKKPGQNCHHHWGKIVTTTGANLALLTGANLPLNLNQVNLPQVNLTQLNLPPYPPQGGLEEKKKFSKNQKQNSQMDMVSSDQRSKKTTSRPAPLSRKAQLGALRKSDPELFKAAEHYAQITLSRRRDKFHLPPVDEAEDYLQTVIYNALLGDRQEAFKKWRAGREPRPKRRWVTPEQMAGKAS